MRSSSILVRVLLFILSVSFAISTGTTAVQATSVHPFYWEKIDVDLQLLESGNLLVAETQQYVFTDKYTNQRTRYIQLDRIDEIKDITVTENNLPVANLQTSKADGRQYISWEHPQITKFPESHTFILKYRVVGGLEVGNTVTNLRWMAIFPDRKTAIKSAQVTVHLPAKLSEFTKGFTSSGVDTTIKNSDSTTINFIVKGLIEPQAKLQILGQFPTTALNLNKSQWQSQWQFSDRSWVVFLFLPFLWIIFLQFDSGDLSSSSGSRSSLGGGDGGGGGDDGGGGGDGCGGGCGGCGGGD